MSLPLKKKTVIIVAGPTASGKTSVAVELAKYFNTEIISADSRQCYRELNIGVARPSASQLSEVKHHFIASHSIHDDLNVAAFEKYALEKADEILKERDIVIMVGGTGLYIKAFCEGLDEVPTIPDVVRQKVSSGFENNGLVWIQKQLQEKDPVFFEKGEIKNPQRSMRALEVVEATGESIMAFRKGIKVKRHFNVIKIGLSLPKDRLTQNIETRVDDMILHGLAAEAKSLYSYKQLSALQTVGYREIFDWMDENSSFEQAIQLIKKNTKQYAKRQLTWFRKDKTFEWLEPESMDKIFSYLFAK
jgi:tRNA dimethylallyltransferase